MKRELGAMALLMALVLVALWNMRRADFLVGQIDMNLVRAEHALESGDFDRALSAVDYGLSLWNSARGYTSVFLRHADVDSVADAFHDLRELLMQRSADAAPAGFARLRYHLGTTDRMEHLSLGSVF